MSSTKVAHTLESFTPFAKLNVDYEKKRPCSFRTVKEAEQKTSFFKVICNVIDKLDRHHNSRTESREVGERMDSIEIKFGRMANVDEDLNEAAANIEKGSKHIRFIGGLNYKASSKRFHQRAHKAKARYPAPGVINEVKQLFADDTVDKKNLAIKSSGRHITFAPCIKPSSDSDSDKPLALQARKALLKANVRARMATYPRRDHSNSEASSPTHGCLKRARTQAPQNAEAESSAGAIRQERGVHFRPYAIVRDDFFRAVPLKSRPDSAAFKQRLREHKNKHPEWGPYF